MKRRKAGAILVFAFALVASSASAANAAAVTEDVQWYTGAAPGMLLTGSETISATGSNEFVWEVGTTKLKLKSTGMECLECKIQNSGGTAIGTGRLKFTGVTVVEPASCGVEGGAVITEVLELKADYMIGTSNYISFEPDEASGATRFATLKLIKGTGSCPIAGTYPITGSEYAKSSSATGVFAVSQGVTTSGPINKEAGGQLFLSAHPAEPNGTASFSLSGARKGTAFATR